MLGFFVGQVMKASKGQASPQIVNELLAKKLRLDQLQAPDVRLGHTNPYTVIPLPSLWSSDLRLALPLP